MENSIEPLRDKRGFTEEELYERQVVLEQLKVFEAEFQKEYRRKIEEEKRAKSDRVTSIWTESNEIYSLLEPNSENVPNLEHLKLKNSF